MNILLTGAAGQLGRELVSLLTPFSPVVGVDRDQPPAQCTESICQDLSDMGLTEALLNRVRPRAVINAAAWTAVDAAQENASQAHCLNADLPALLADWCARNDACLMHYSTDYVFNGESSRPYTEQDLPAPASIYGESKLAGEQAIGASGCRHVILRSSWIYSAHGNNFLLTMLRLAAERPRLSVVADQTGCPTWARNLARASQVVLRRQFDANGGDKFNGLFHYCDATVTSWHGFAQAIFSAAVSAGLLDRAPKLEAITTADYPTPARRPLYSVLDTHAIQSRFAIRPPSLAESLHACLGDIA